MGEPALRASQVREDIWQRCEGIGIDLDTSRDRSACVWTLDEQNTLRPSYHPSFPATRRVQDLAAGDIGKNNGEFKCRCDEGLGRGRPGVGLRPCTGERRAGLTTRGTH